MCILSTIYSNQLYMYVEDTLFIKIFVYNRGI